MTKTNKSYLNKITRILISVLNVVAIFLCAFWNTAVLTDGSNVDPGDQLQFACVAAGVVILGYLLASLTQVKPGSMARFWIVMTANFIAAPVFMTMIYANNGMTSLTDCLYFGMAPLILGIVAPFILFLVLEE